MTRQIVAHHDPVVLAAAPHVGWALAVHRAVPALSLIELLERVAQPGPASRALEHARACAHCDDTQLCEAGERLAKQITPPPRTRAWLALRAAAVAQARARTREGAA
jgi:hypothetical protein